MNKGVLNDNFSRGYLIRVERARQEREDKMRMTNWNSRGSLPKKKINYNKFTLNNLNTRDEITSNTILEEDLNRNLSQINLNYAKKSLRNELHSINILSKESDDEY